MSHYSLILLTIAFTLLTPFPSSSADTQLINDTCKKIAHDELLLGGNYKICVDFLQSDPRSATTTLEELGEIAFEVTQKKTVTLESQIKTLLGSPKTDTEIKKVLTDCAEMYKKAEDSIGEALKAYKEKNFFLAYTHASVAFDVPSDCEDGFKGLTSPLMQVNKDIEKFYGIDLVFINMFHK